jgi:colicin import membrane protein
MSTIITTASSEPEPGSQDDPYRYGWRFVRRKDANGTDTVEQVPLTVEDLLHPQEGDCVVESTLHERTRRYLMGHFEARLAGDRSQLVVSDCRISWGVRGVRPHCADVAVIVGLRKRRDDYRTFYMRREGARAALVIEIVSPDDAEVRDNDIVRKLAEYHKVKVPFYVIVDRLYEDAPIRLIGNRYTPKCFVRMKPDKRGRLWLEPVKLWMGLKRRRVVLYDGDTDKELLDLPAANAALQAAEARIHELEVKLRRLNGNATGGSSTSK